MPKPFCYNCGAIFSDSETSKKLESVTLYQLSDKECKKV